MAQERFWNWKDDDLTFRLNWRDLGIHEAGRYRGFDWTPVAGMSFQFNHAATGVVKTKADYTASPKIGVWLSKQGCMITEDANVNVGTVNPTASLPRIDLIVGRHQYVYSVGGAFATYAILQGTPAAVPVAPTLPFPNEQVILGQLYLPANATNLNDVGVVFTPAKVPYFANTQLGLSDNYDCEVTNQTAGDILLSFGAEFKNVNGKTYIESLNIKMNNAFEEKGIVYSSIASIPKVIVSGAGGDGFNISGVNKVIIDTGTSDVFTIAGLPSTYQLGSVIRLSIIDTAYNVKIQLNSNIATGSAGAFLPIKHSFNLNDSSLVQNKRRFYRFERHQNYWLLIEEFPLKSGEVLPYKGVLVGYFDDIVGNAPLGSEAVGTSFGGLAVVNGAIIPITITCILNTPDDSGYSVTWANPIEYDNIRFMIYDTDGGVISGNKTNDVSYPIVQELTSTGFKFYMTEIHPNQQSAVWVYMVLEKTLIW